jgi:hypothetical protein
MPSRRSLLNVGVSGSTIAFLTILADISMASAATLTNSNCPDPTGWSDARFDAHAGYPSIGNPEGLNANCTNYAAWVLMSRGVPEGDLRGLGSGGQWASNAAGRWPVNSTPAVGAIGQATSYGHVAQVESVNSNGTLEISESNWRSGGTRYWLDRRTVATSYFDKFIHIKDGSTNGSGGDDMPSWISALDDRAGGRDLAANEWTFLFTSTSSEGSLGGPVMLARDGGMIDVTAKIAVSGLGPNDVIQIRAVRVDQDGSNRLVSLEFNPVDLRGSDQPTDYLSFSDKFNISNGSSHGGGIQVRPLVEGVHLVWSDMRAFQFR